MNPKGAGPPATVTVQTDEGGNNYLSRVGKQSGLETRCRFAKNVCLF